MGAPSTIFAKTPEFRVALVCKRRQPDDSTYPIRAHTVRVEAYLARRGIALGLVPFKDTKALYGLAQCPPNTETGGC